MSVDQIYKKFLHGLLLACLLSAPLACRQVSERAARPAARPTPTGSLQPAAALQPPVPLKQLGHEPVSALHVLASLNSRDREGQRRLQLYLSHPAPDQAFYWQIVRLYRSQYDAIWIYTRPQATWSESDWPGRAAWFAPGTSPASRHPDFSPKHENDGLYWRDAR